MAVLKNIDFVIMLIGAEGARLLRDYGVGLTPQVLKRRGGSPDRPGKAKRLERKSTDKFTLIKPINLLLLEESDIPIWK